MLAFTASQRTSGVVPLQTVLGVLLNLTVGATHATADNFTWTGAGTTSWDDAASWSGAFGIPDTNTDTVLINIPSPDPQLVSNRVIGELTLSSNGDLVLDIFRLTVQNSGGQSGTTTVGGAGSDLNVQQGNLSTDHLQIDADGEIDVRGGTVLAQVTPNINDNGLLEGFGTFVVNSGASNIVNNGTISASGGTLLIRRSGGTARFDWDGSDSNGAELIVSQGATMDIDIPLADTLFNGTITLNSAVGQPSTFDVVDAYGLDKLGADPGILNKNGPGTGTVTGGAVTLVGNGSQLNVNEGTLVFDTDLAAQTGSDVVVAAGATLQLNSDATYNAATATSLGTLQHNSTATINASTSISTTGFHIGSGANVTMNNGFVSTSDFLKDASGGLDLEGGTFTVDGGTGTFNSSVAFSGPTEAIQPTFVVQNGADVAVTFSWRVGVSAGEFGTTIVTGANGGVPSMLRGTGGGAGADLYVGSAGTGRLEVLNGGLVEFGDDFVLGDQSGSSGTTVVSGVNGGLRSTVEAVRNGGSSSVFVGLSGSGNLAIADGALVQTTGVLPIALSPGSSGVITVGGSSGGFDATLEVSNDLFVGGGGVANGGIGSLTVNAGGKVDVGGEIKVWPSGNVTVNSDGAIDPHLLTMEGGTFTQNSFSTVVISDAPASPGSGLHIGAGGGNGIIQLNNGTINASTINVSAGGVLNVDGGLLDASNVLLPAGTMNLTGGIALVRTINRTGGGLFSFTGGELAVANFRGDLDNQGGTLAPGIPLDPTRLTTIDGDYTQGPDGNFEGQGEDLDPDSYDRLHVTGDLNLDGTLTLVNLTPFPAPYGSIFDAITYDGTRTGTFAVIDDGASPLGSSPAGFQVEWLMDYEHPGLVELIAAVRADMDLDGDVDLDDVANFVLALNDSQQYLDTFGHGGSMAGDTDLDFDLDLDDVVGFVDILTGGAGSGGHAVPEPASWVLMLLAAFSCGAAVRRSPGRERS